MIFEQSLVVIAAFIAAVVFTPLVRKMAFRFGIVDRPDPLRKLHGRTVARAGGVAVLLAVLVACGGALFRFDTRNLLNLDITPFIGLLVVMIGVNLLGLADDIWTLRGRQKLLGQIALAMVLVFTGFKIAHVQLFGFAIELGYLAIPVTLVWLLATTNALNLIDGSDGLCSSLGAVISGALGVIASMNGHFAEAAIAFALCGALIGFLVFNFPPASIFLGDSGSLLIGMITGALAIRCSIKGPASVAFLAPLAVLSIPLLDSAMAIVRRKLTGRSIYTTDRAHLHHSLKDKGLGEVGLVMVVIAMALITSAGAIFSQLLGRDWLALVGTGAVFAALVLTRAFGHAEMVLVARRARNFAKSLLEPATKTDQITHSKTVRLQGNRQWETIWNTLVEFAEAEQLCKLGYGSERALVARRFSRFMAPQPPARSPRTLVSRFADFRRRTHRWSHRCYGSSQRWRDASVDRKARRIARRFDSASRSHHGWRRHVDSRRNSIVRRSVCRSELGSVRSFACVVVGW